ncbi:ABC transporter substrate-binding protein [Chondromyces apiculatus]|uniref:Vitamin B12 ABC transporter, B12-binding component BtuF n=1 Tax=Chondromyces apiculatus DSM 436 TaxID=1192034 RepID=A0A017T5K8_9BACT|nr:helical backbone metal receptor [Chondromyces apiculatus]EYF04065.1 Vitamin B12 ABC transporter, B12-binding component BtuF [Chondromyces apiculatus DSM 436]
MITSRRATLFLLAAGAASAAGALTACGRRPDEAATGTAPRVVSLSPSTTEAAFVVGAGATLVGRSRYCDYPEDAARLPAVGGYADPSLESILALRPTLVIGARGPAGPALEGALHAQGIDTFFPETESLAQITSMLTELGRRLAAGPFAAQAIAHIHERRAAVEAAVRDRPRVRVALLFDTAPIVAAGPHGFPDELIRLAGGENVITRGGAYPTLGIEALLALDPEVLLDGATEAHDGTPTASRLLSLRDSPGFRELKAMREGRVRPLRSAAALRPGPRIGEGLVALACAIHGDDLAIASPPPSSPQATP